MSKVTTAFLLMGALALSACNNPDRYGAGGGAGGMGGAGGAGGYGAGGIGAGGLGDASDPNSVAYFNQTIGDKVHFAVDQSTLSSQAQGILSQQAGWMNQHPSYTAIIEGHADEQGTREYNIALGERRAASVRAYLVSQGVMANRLQTVSYGKERPLAVCADETCFAQNRRAATVVGAGMGS